jgi:hypothetical protein
MLGVGADVEGGNGDCLEGGDLVSDGSAVLDDAVTLDAAGVSCFFGLLFRETEWSA